MSASSPGVRLVQALVLAALIPSRLAALMPNSDNAGGAGVWPTSLYFLADCGANEFHDFVRPLAEMAKLSYTATWGSYHEAAAESATVESWTRSSLEANPPEGGMRALAFHRGRRGVVAFRGTDLNASGVSGQADLCADDLLLGRAGPARPLCGRFSAGTLDYLGRALDFADAAEKAHPGVEWLYTGHSLGALLAEVVAAVRGALALGISAPPVAQVLRNRTAVDPAALPAWRALTLYNEWDPLRFEATGQLPGASCAWTVQPAPPGCRACDTSAPAPDMASAACRACFLGTHVFKLYLDLVGSGRRPESCFPSGAPVDAGALSQASLRGGGGAVLI